MDRKCGMEKVCDMNRISGVDRDSSKDRDCGIHRAYDMNRDWCGVWARTEVYVGIVVRTGTLGIGRDYGMEKDSGTGRDCYGDRDYGVVRDCGGTNPYSTGTYLTVGFGNNYTDKPWLPIITVLQRLAFPHRSLYVR